MVKQYQLRNGMLDRERKLTLAPDFVEFEKSDLITNRFHRMLKADIRYIKFRADPIFWYCFIVGTKYKIGFKDTNGDVLEVQFREYNWSNPGYDVAYAETIKTIWDYYLYDLVNERFRMFQAEGEVTIGRMRIHLDGIEIIGTGLRFLWNNLLLKEYQRHFLLARNDAAEFHMVIDFNEWDAQLAYHVIYLIKTKFGASTSTGLHA